MGGGRRPGREQRPFAEAAAFGEAGIPAAGGNPAKVPAAHQIFVSGDDEDAKEQAAVLLGEFGWPADRVIDIGGVGSARAAEMTMPQWRTLLRRFGDAEFNFGARRAAHRPPSGRVPERSGGYPLNWNLLSGNCC
ncbi:hypothetical protein [Streptomyces sp. NPDC001970]